MSLHTAAARAALLLTMGVLGACQLTPQAEGPVAALPPAAPSGVAMPATRAANAALAARLPLDDPRDFESVSRGFLARIEADAIRDSEGGVVFPIADFEALSGDAPDTVNPSLWRQAMLTNAHGLYEVMDGLYQVRGYDISVMSVIRGETGWILIDPMLSTETAAAGLKLVNDTLGERPVTGLIYTHSHGDHFGGARGVIDEAEARARGVPILAPEGFTREAVSENVIAGPHMTRRAQLMFGNNLPIGPQHHVSVGLGPALSRGTVSLILPTEEVPMTGGTRMIDGIVFEFIDANETEAPAEFMFYLPQFRALCVAEVANATFHNLLTPRGAQIRNALKWSEVIDHVLLEYGGRSDLAFGSHHWPVWGQENVTRYLRGQRDVYRYTHDQVLRRANAGATIIEVAETLPEPAGSDTEFHMRGYYGTLNHNAKAVYQYYFGWWDGVPANYVLHVPEERARRFVALGGGREAVLAAGIAAFEAGDYRWASEVLNNLVFAEPDFTPGRDWLAASYEQIGYQAESGAWRAYFLSAAQELRLGPPAAGSALINADFIAAIPTAEFFNALAARYVPERLGRAPFAINFAFPDTGETFSVDAGAATAFPRAGYQDPGAAVSLTLPRQAFLGMVAGIVSLPDLLASGAASLEGDPGALGAWSGALEAPPESFTLVEP